MLAPPPVRTELAQARLAVRRKIMGTVAVAAVAGVALDLVGGITLNPLLMAARVLFVISLVPAVLVLPRVGEVGARRVVVGVCFAASVAMTMMSAATGGTHSPAFTFMWALPMVAGLLFVDQPIASLVTGLSVMLAAALLHAGEAKPTVETVYWVLVTLVSTLIATFATTLYRRLQKKEVAVEQERALALQGLAALERERAKTERFVLLGRLTAGVAHEVNNPLAYLKSNLGHLLAQRRAGRNEQLLGDLEEIVTDCLTGVDRIARMVEDLRTFSLPEPEHQEVSRIDRLIEDAERLAHVRVKTYAVNKEIEPGLPLVNVNSHRVVQVLTHLLINAADALDEARGAGRPNEGLRITVRARLKARKVTVEVEDNGPGLPANVSAQLFQPFLTTKSKGAGLGLALSHEFIRRQGGELEGGNAETGGARFAFTLPIATLAG